MRGLRKTSSRSGLLGIAGDVHDQKLKRQRDLRGSEAQPLGLIHQIDHLADAVARSSLSTALTGIDLWRRAGCG